MSIENGILLHFEDADRIVGVPGSSGVAVIDAAGDCITLGRLMTGYTDEQFRDILRFANGFYAHGVRDGRSDAQARMRIALGLIEEGQTP